MKLNNTQKNIIIFFSTIISIFFASFIWDKITIPFSNPSGANGLLVVQKYNPINDTLRYIFFISLPLIVFFYLNLSLKRKKFNLINLFFEREQKVFNNPHVVNILFFIFIIFLILEFLSLGFFPNVPFDHFHDGTFLSPAQNYIANKKIWTGSYLTHGGSDILYPILMWKLLGVESIGSFRTYSIILVLILKIICVLFSYQITKILNLDKSGKIIFFTLFTSIIISMSVYSLQSFGYFLIPRHIYILIFLYFFIELFIKTNFRNFSLILITLISTISIFLHIDTGVYLNVIIFTYLIYLLIIKKYKNAFLIISSIFVFWFILAQIVGYDEFIAFLNNTKMMIISMDIMHGFEYPQPFFSMIEDERYGTRATRGLVLQLLAGLFVLNYIISGNKKIFRSKNIFFVFLFFLSFLMYKNGLSRSDVGHIKMANALPIIINSIFILNYLINYLFNKKNYTKIFNYKNAFSISIIFLIIFYTLGYKKYKIENIVNFNKNFTKYIYLDDEDFLNNKEIKLLNNYKKIFKNEKCVTNYTLDDGLNYLIKKPSCNKHWSAWLASPTTLQKIYVSDISKIQPKYIIYNPGGNFDGLTLVDRTGIINSYILSNYIKYKQFEKYTILKKK